MLHKHFYILHLHRVQCPQDQCKLEEWFGANIDEIELEVIVTKILDVKKDMNHHNRIVYELWMFELGKKPVVNFLIHK